MAPFYFVSRLTLVMTVITLLQIAFSQEGSGTYLRVVIYNLYIYTILYIFRILQKALVHMCSLYVCIITSFLKHKFEKFRETGGPPEISRRATCGRPMSCGLDSTDLDLATENMNICNLLWQKEADVANDRTREIS